MKESDIGKRVDEQALKLIEEFKQHYQGYIKAHPEQTDRAKIFEGWAIQKIAGLQLIVFDLAKSINALAQQPPASRAIAEELLPEKLRKRWEEEGVL